MLEKQTERPSDRISLVELRNICMNKYKHIRYMKRTKKTYSDNIKNVLSENDLIRYL